MNEKINIYTGNHKYNYGIQDIIIMLENIFKRKKISYKISSSLDSNCNNIIIEEFTSIHITNQIKTLRSSNKKFKVTLIASEFITSHESKVSKFSFKTSFFNNFDLTNTFFIILFSILSNLYSNIFILNTVKTFLYISKTVVMLLNFSLTIPFRIIHFLFLIINFFLKIFLANRIYKKHIKYFADKMKIYFDYLYTNIRFDKILKIFSLKRNKKHINYFYFFLRYNFFLKAAPLIDYVIFLHPEQINQYKYLNLNTLGCITPEFSVDNFMQKIQHASFGIKMSGTLTSFRKKMLKTFCQKYFFYNKKHIPFSLKTFSNDNFSNYVFSFHPSQIDKWQFLSPTRIFRSFNSDFSIPIITKKFNQSFIEDICINLNEENEIDLYNNLLCEEKYKNYYPKLHTKLKKYIQKSIINNDKVFKNIV